MRISDWSSDVCSSDLGGNRHPDRLAVIAAELHLVALDRAFLAQQRQVASAVLGVDVEIADVRRLAGVQQPAEDLARGRTLVDDETVLGAHHGDRHRSEEHTSELQSLMRTSYAVFCLKKNNNPTTHLTSLLTYTT